VIIWFAAEFHCHVTLQFIIMFITCIDDDDDNDDLNVINLMHLNLSNFLFVKFHQFFFEIKVPVSNAVSSY